MRLIILIALASIFGYAVLQIDKIDPDNYVKMYLGNYVVEVKVLGFILLLIAAVALLYFVLWLVRWIWRSPRIFGAWRTRRNRNLADEQFGAGYLSLIKGDWQRAEKQLVSKSDHSHVPYVNYLAAARAAQEQGRIEQRDEYLQLAYEAAPGERLAIGLTKARLHQKAGQIELARATLEDVEELGRNNPQFTAMLVQTLKEQQEWSGIQALLPKARKQKALPATMLEELQDNSYSHGLLHADNIATAWKDLPRAQRKRADNIALYAMSMIESGEHSQAEKLIRAGLNTALSDQLIEIYGQLESDKPAKLLRRMEGWLMAQPKNPIFNLAAGRLAVAAKSLDIAEQYFQAAITNGPLPAAYSELGELLEMNNESSKALQMYRVGMQSLDKESKSLDVMKGALLEKPKV